MKVGLFGGSFDPVHAGHVESAAAARRALGLDRVELVVTGRAPHKPGSRAAPALARYAMVELALLDRDDFAASGAELDDERPSYTIDTLEARRRAQPGAEIWWIVGSDAFAALDTWRRFEAILEGFPIAVLTRPGFERDELLDRLAPELRRRLPSARVEWIDNPRILASSTAIRARLAAGEDPPEGWLEPRVLRFIHKYRLYR